MKGRRRENELVPTFLKPRNSRNIFMQIGCETTESEREGKNVKTSANTLSEKRKEEEGKLSFSGIVSNHSKWRTRFRVSNFFSFLPLRFSSSFSVPQKWAREWKKQKIPWLKIMRHFSSSLEIIYAFWQWGWLNLWITTLISVSSSQRFASWKPRDQEGEMKKKWNGHDFHIDIFERSRFDTDSL